MRDPVYDPSQIPFASFHYCGVDFSVEKVLRSGWTCHKVDKKFSLRKSYDGRHLYKDPKTRYQFRTTQGDGCLYYVDVREGEMRFSPHATCVYERNQFYKPLREYLVDVTLEDEGWLLEQLAALQDLKPNRKRKSIPADIISLEQFMKVS